MKYKRKKPRPPRDIPYQSIILIFLITFIVRLIFILLMKNNAYSIITRYTIDSIYYHDWAMKIAQGDWIGKEVFFMGPFYAYFLGIIYAILGNKIIVVQIIQAILAGCSSMFLYLITRKISNHRNGVIAGVIYILSGILIFYTGALLYVEINIFLSLLLAYLLLGLIDANREKSISGKLILSGIVMGLLVMVRPEFILLLAVLIPYFIIKIRPKRILQYIVFTFFALITISIIPLRNYLVSKDFIPFTAHSGVNFYYGNNPQTDGTWRPVYPLQQTPDISIAQLQYSSQRIDGKLVRPSEASKHWMQKGFDFIKKNPWRYAKLLGRKLLLFFNSYEIPNNYYFYQTRDDSSILKICFVSFAVILPLAILGIAFSLKKWKDFYLVYSFIFIYLVSSLVFYVLSRLRAPVMPFLIIFSAVFIGEIIEKLKDGKFKQVLLLIVITGIFFGLTQINLVNEQEFNTQGFVQKGNIYQSVRNFPMAADKYNKALAIEPKNVVIRYSLLQTYISMNRPSPANTELQAITNIASTNPNYQVYAHLGLARYSIAQRNFTQAAVEFEQAVLLNPYDAETHYLLGAVYITLGRNIQALKEIQKTLELDPNHPDAQRALTMLQNIPKK